MHVTALPASTQEYTLTPRFTSMNVDQKMATWHGHNDKHLPHQVAERESQLVDLISEVPVSRGKESFRH